VETFGYDLAIPGIACVEPCWNGDKASALWSLAEKKLNVRRGREPPRA
jgi:hypothetical protein